MPSGAKVVTRAEKETGHDSPWPAALRILTRRDYSMAELRKRLADKGFGSELIEETLQRCLDLGYLNDERFATNRATSLMNQGRAVGHRILQDLRQRGISEDMAERALARAREVHNEESLLAELLDRRFQNFNYTSAPAKEKRRVINFLQRRGFPLTLIMDYLTRKGSASDNEDR